MKTIYSILIFLLCICCINSYSQAPAAIPFQAVARDNNGNPIINTMISLRFSIHDSSAGGPIIYTETHTITTTLLGYFLVNVGQGTPVTGTFSSINWGDGSKYLKIEMDAAGGSNYTNMGSQQILSVPYALYSGSSNDWTKTGTNLSNNNSGNVGIGTSTPDEKLHVKGSIKIVDGSEGTGKLLKSDASGLASWGTIGSNDILASEPDKDFSCRVVTGSAATGNQPSWVSVSGNYAYVVNENGNTMQVFNISNPASPSLVGSVGIGNQSRALAISGHYAYVVSTGSNTMQIIDITNPALPVIVSTTGTNNSPVSIFISGSYAYVCDQFDYTLQIIDISNPSSPTITGQVTTAGITRCVSVSGNYAYVLNFNVNSMQIIDISNHSSPSIVSSIIVGGGPVSVAISGHYAYVIGAYSQSLTAIDVSNPALPTVTSSISVGNNPLQVFISGKYAYVANLVSNNMQIVNIENPAAMTSMGTITTNVFPNSVAVSGNYAYVVNHTSNTLQVIKLACDSYYSLTVNSATGQTSAVPMQWKDAGNNISNTNTANVGIGTSTPTSKLEVAGEIRSSTDNASLNLQRTTGANYINFNDANALYFRGISAGNTNANIRMAIDNVGRVGIGASILTEDLAVRNAAQATNMSVSTDDNHFLNFFSGSAGDNNSAIITDDGQAMRFGQWTNLQGHAGFVERMRIDANGNVAIGTASPTQKLMVSGNICATGSIGACSDSRYKKEIKPLQNSLEKVLHMKGVNYYWKSKEFPDKQFNDKKQIGFIAQDIEKIYPELVITDVDGYKSVDYSKVTPILVEAIKELKAENDNLKAENNQFKTDVDKLKSENSSFKSDIQQIKAELGLDVKASK